MRIDNVYYGSNSITQIRYGDKGIKAVVYKPTASADPKIVYFAGNPGFISKKTEGANSMTIVDTVTTELYDNLTVGGLDTDGATIAPIKRIERLDGAYTTCYIDSSINYIGVDAFKHTSTKLKLSIIQPNAGGYVSYGNSVLEQLNGIWTLRSGCPATQFNATASSSVIPTAIGRRALSSVILANPRQTLPSSVDTIEPYAFADSNIEENILQSTGIKTIKAGAFSGCYNIDGLVDLYSTKITSLAGDAFAETSIANFVAPLGLSGFSSSCYWPDTIQSIFLPGVVEFKLDMLASAYTCTKLTTLLFTGDPASSRYVNNLKTIEAGAFGTGARYLTHVYVYGNSSKWQSVAADGTVRETKTFDNISSDTRAQQLCAWLKSTNGVSYLTCRRID